MKTLLRWILDLFCVLVALLGALLVGWSSIEAYYLMTGRVQPGFEQPPLAVVAGMFIAGLILLFGGWALRRRLRKNAAL